MLLFSLNGKFGFYMGKAKFITAHKRLYISLALVVPFVLHSLYDYIISVQERSWVYWITPFMIVLWIISFRKIRVANQHHEEILKP